jgi:arylformamidase
MTSAMVTQALGRARLFDLSQPLFSGCPGWYGYPPAVVEATWTIKEQGFNAEHLDLMTHTGTHLDVPYHFVADGRRIEQVGVEEFQGQAVVLDLRFVQPNQAIGPDELQPFAGRIEAGDIVVLCTGWGEKRSLDDVFMRQWPYISADGAQWLIDRQVRAVAVDTLSIGGSTPETGRPAHVALLGAGFWALEDIRVPEEVIAAGRCHLFSFPLLIPGAGGAQVRVVAAVE